jgi:hypothetical protein
MTSQKDDGRLPIDTAPKDNTLIWLLVDYRLMASQRPA